MPGLDALAAAVEPVAPLPWRDANPVFHEPWEATVFAMTLALHEQGVFTWPEWAALLATVIREAQTEGDPDLGDTYYRHWLKAFETMIAQKRIADTATLQTIKSAWDRAAHATPHGQPILLENDPERRKPSP